MKFRFCGDLDCPDWVLAEISVLSKVTSVKMKLICQQVIKDLLGEGIDYAKVQKLTTDAKYDSSDIKASLAALNFIFSSAAKYGVDGESLSNELQQLGLPKELAGSVCKVYQDKLDNLQKVFHERSFKLDQMKDLQWRVDYVLSSSHVKDLNQPEIHLQFTRVDSATGTEEKVSFAMTSDKFRVFLNELKHAKTVMAGL